MSGHSKWSTIKHRKALTDAKKAKVFSGLSKEISIAAKDGGADPETNARLRAVIEKAKKFNLPSGNIERIIKKSTEPQEGAGYLELLIEGYGPFGVAIIIKAITDNKNRTISEIRHTLSKHEGNLGTEGAVMWLFKVVGKIMIDLEGQDKNTLQMAAIEAGAEDIIIENENMVVFTKPEDLYQVKESLKSAGIENVSPSIDYIPINILSVQKEGEEKVRSLLEELGENDDVQEVYSNTDIKID